MHIAPGSFHGCHRVREVIPRRNSGPPWRYSASVVGAGFSPRRHGASARCKASHGLDRRADYPTRGYTSIVSRPAAVDPGAPIRPASGSTPAPPVACRRTVAGDGPRPATDRGARGAVLATASIPWIAGGLSALSQGAPRRRPRTPPACDGWGFGGAQRPPTGHRAPERSEGVEQEARSADCLTAGKLAGATTSGAQRLMMIE